MFFFFQNFNFIKIYLYLYIYRLITVAFFSLYIFITPLLRNSDFSFSYYYYALYMLLNVINNSFSFILYLSIGSFTSQISDKSIGGTYMTFLSLWGGLGMIISRTLVLFLTDLFTLKNCNFDSNDSANKNLSKNLINNISNFLKNNACSNENESRICKEYGGQCIIYFDALYLLTFIFVAIGFIWLVFSREIIEKLQSLPKSVWLVSSEDKMNKKNQEIISI